ncbi:MAG: hypothetical protein WBL67_15155 [Nitrososphaeraceae archaeon]
MTGETEEAAPILGRLQEELESLEDEIDEATEKKDRHSKRELRRRFHEIQRELNETKEKVQKLIILDNKILLLLDTARDSFYNALMSLISQDTKEDQKYIFTEQTNGRKFTSKTNRIRGTPVIFTTQVIDDSKGQRFGEKNRRFVNVNPDTSAKKIMAAKNLIGLKGGLLPEEYDRLVVSREEKEKAKRIGDRIAQKLVNHSKYFEPKETGVKIPFVESIPNSIPGDPNDVWGMTVMDRLIKYLAVITKVNMDSRPMLVDLETEGKFYPISIFADLDEALQLLGNASSNLRPYIADWYNKIFITGFKEVKQNEGLNQTLTPGGELIESENVVGLTTKYLAKRTQDIKGTKLSPKEIRDQYLEPLYNLGIVDKFQSGLDRRENLYCPVDEVGTSSIFAMSDDANPYDYRLKVKEPHLYPSKNILMNCIRTFVKKNVQSPTSTTNFQNFQKYRLVDHNGVEITTEELIDRYLSNPEKAFKKDYPPENKAAEEDQKLVRPILNNLWMLQSVRSNLQMFPHNDMELSSTAETPKPVIGRNDEGNGNGQIKNKKYSDCLVDGIPIWEIEKRGMTAEEAEAFRQECERLNKIGDKGS